MTGGDFPAWLPTLFAVGPVAQASAANLVDRRGECIHAGCPHYRVCFIERAIRASRRADLVIANHALVMTQAAYDGARTARGQPADIESAHLKRIVFDEGHHLFDAADSAFAACLSGRGGGRDAPLDPRAGGPRPARARAGGAAQRAGGRARAGPRSAEPGGARRRRPAGRGLVGPHRAARRRGQPDRADRGLPGRGAGAAEGPRRGLRARHGVPGAAGAGAGARDRGGGRAGAGGRRGAAGGAGALPGRRARRGLGRR